ncbi:hypothetical protein [Pseudophaeobacter sp.]|jgi:hypothetical protein|uniref:hypothetical protein n=1 Tax=Pseudophaeobacter TaxID=1541822 RepID=UPI0021FF2C0F|nr:hypothetical protein [uncultured Pseudophaeobacter sp.]UWS78788.1 hypothetical protein N1037_16160 [Phaeobacter sp. G2]
MFEVFSTTAATLAIVLYFQARHCARIIRRNRANAPEPLRSMQIDPVSPRNR